MPDIHATGDPMCMNQVLGELLRAEGCELHLEPISNYLDPSSKELSFWEVRLPTSVCCGCIRLLSFNPCATEYPA